MADGCMNRDGVGFCAARCSRNYDADATKVAGAVLAEARKRGLLIEPHNPVAVCVVDRPAPISCGGSPVYGCALPMRDRLAIYIAGKHHDWKRTLAHEALCVLAYAGKLKGWPKQEKDVLAAANAGKLPDYGTIRDLAGAATSTR